MIPFFTPTKFLSLPLPQQHKKASEWLRCIFEGDETKVEEYRAIERWLKLEQVELKNNKLLSDRYHWHLKQANVSWQEHHFLPQVRKQDAVSTSIHFLPIGIYLEHLRSAFNVGSILRTVEAFRLGTVFFSSRTPFIDNPKVQKVSMGTFDKVPCLADCSLKQLPRPLIALETVEASQSVFDFSFPEAFTLLVGNEEYGLSDEALSQADFTIQIPLFGTKNSLNVAVAFGIAASVISHQKRR